MTQALGIPVLFLLESLKTIMLEVRKKQKNYLEKKYQRPKKLNKRFYQVKKVIF
jgi:hypothetical protein